MTSPIDPTQPAAATASRPTLNPPLRQLLSAWLPQQRWFMGKGSTPILRRVGGYRFTDPAGVVDVDVHLRARPALDL